MNESHKIFDKQDEQAALLSTRRVNLSEALKENAHKQKRNMLAWAGAAFLVAAYNVHINHIPWIDADISPDSPIAAAVIVAVPLLYSFVGFLLYAIADLRMWRISAEQNWQSPQYNLLFRLQANTHAILSQLDDTQRPAHVVPEQSRKVIEGALEEAKHAVQTLNSLRQSAVTLTALNRLIAYGWEFLLPVIVGLVALYFSLPAFWTSFWQLVRR
jgi:hypothetical protein